MALPRTLTLVYHAREPYPAEVLLEDVYRDLQVRAAPGRPAVILNMVQTLDGAVAVEGRAWTIGSAVDHFLFRTLRGWADAVLCGAGTLWRHDLVPTTHPELQAERIASGRPGHPAAVVVTRRAEFPDEVLARRFFARRDFASIVLTTELARDVDRRRLEAAGAEVLVVPATPEGEVDLAAALGLLQARGVHRVLVEGGPQTNRRLAASRALDELFLTVAPTLAGVPDPSRVLAGVLGGARVRLSVISEFHYRTPALREWYLRFAVSFAEGP
ncbi:MAG: dihydrofolate reductase family protein [Armatimonadota bacterium]|nr:dihydrofolate reductase family protein [Armatimonadota bacterium]MDR7518643.1 dihydrofolate reductase family protein [Armatimonadota bacterium]MDR7549834.1 dihydrofolate reductase family protein [Armatimonadota bacterium]